MDTEIFAVRLVDKEGRKSEWEFAFHEESRICLGVGSLIYDDEFFYLSEWAKRRGLEVEEIVIPIILPE